MKSEELYKQYYSNRDFQTTYISGRSWHYEKISRIIATFTPGNALDFGCSFGGLVETLLKDNVNAYGIDLPVTELVAHHQHLNSDIQQRLIYQTMDGENLARFFSSRNIQTLIVADTIRHLEDLEMLIASKWSYACVKEVCRNPIMQLLRRNQRDIRLYAPNDICDVFNATPLFISLWKFRINIRSPSRALLFVLNLLSPSYILVVKRKEPPK